MISPWTWDADIIVAKTWRVYRVGIILGHIKNPSGLCNDIKTMNKESMAVNGNQWQSMPINDFSMNNPWAIHDRAMPINGFQPQKQWKNQRYVGARRAGDTWLDNPSGHPPASPVNGNQWESMGINANQWQSMPINANQWQSMISPWTIHETVQCQSMPCNDGRGLGW